MGACKACAVQGMDREADAKMQVSDLLLACPFCGNSLAGVVVFSLRACAMIATQIFALERAQDCHDQYMRMLQAPGLLGWARKMATTFSQPKLAAFHKVETGTHPCALDCTMDLRMDSSSIQ